MKKVQQEKEPEHKKKNTNENTQQTDEWGEDDREANMKKTEWRVEL